jgi:hypothetical protein
MKTVVVSGALANRPGNGGGAWVRLNWVLGLKRLGLEVYFVEAIGRRTCVDETGTVTSFENSVNRAYFQEVTEQFGFGRASALVYEDGEQVHGLGYRDLLDLAASADLLVNISGHLTIEPLFKRFRRKVYIDLDPGFTQIWHASNNLGARLAGHDYYFTVGENIGRPDCSIPTNGLCWRPIRPPVVLEEWPITFTLDPERFTTVGSWRGPYGSVQWNGKTLGLKLHEFRKFMELPSRSPYTFEMALNIHPNEEKDLQALRHHGCKLVDPLTVAGTPNAFRQYLQKSGAEFSAAQGVYVETNSGWVSDRTVEYLACGKPVLVQDTGLGLNYPVGEGLVTFRTLQEAVERAARISSNYHRHCQAARALAENYFDSDKVLPRFLEQLG